MQIAQWFIKNYPKYLKDMQECSYGYSKEQPNFHHLEGDVWTHAKNGYLCAIENKLSQTIQWATLLHDIGRTLTRRVNRKKSSVSFGNYEGVSVYLALDILNDTQLSEEEKTSILKLIAFQYTIIDHIKFDSPSYEELLKKFKYDEKLLFELANYVKCDIKARKIESSRFNLYDTNRIEHLIYTTSKLHTLQKHQSEKKYTVHILVGPPCTRKSSYTQQFQTDPNYIIINRDSCVEEIGKKYGKYSYNEAYDLMKADKAIKKEIDSLDEKREDIAKTSKNKNIIIDNPNLSIKNREEWIDAFSDTHTIKATLFFSSFKNLLECDKQRKKQINKSIDKSGFIYKLTKFEFPLVSEGIDIIEYKF